MKYGIICKVCDRLLWVGEVKPKPGEVMTSKGWLHAVTMEKARPRERIQWCGCKGKVAYTELTEPR